MRTLVHLSDLHFGRVDAALIEPLLAAVTTIGADLVVVSGDLTQRARSAEFRAARAFLDRLPAPLIVVPGNHDVPMYRVWERFLSPLGKYRRHITDDLEPAFVDAEIAVVGVNTARSLTFKNGRINPAQMAAIRSRFDAAGDAVTKVVVTHHPFDLPTTHSDEDDLVGRAGTAMQVFAQCGVDLLLAGHFHTGHAGATARRHPIAGYAALAVQAGTTTSTRGRGEVNSFNVLRVEPTQVVVEPWLWDVASGSFSAERKARFERDPRDPGRWVEAEPAA